MCGPVDSKEGDAKREKFMEEFSSECAGAICGRSSILSPSASSPIFEGSPKEISVPADTRRNGKSKNRKLNWIN
jgi:hypothetical protein